MSKYILLFALTLTATTYAQKTENPSGFWADIRYGGNLGLNIGNSFTNIQIAPMAYKPINKYLMIGTGVQYNYTYVSESHSLHAYGGNVIAISTPIPEVQISAEYEMLRCHVNYSDDSISRSFWNKALFLGAGYTSGNITMGLRYNVLNNNNMIHTQAWSPFVRVFF